MISKMSGDDKGCKARALESADAVRNKAVPKKGDYGWFARRGEF